jgi:hypothetical protein
MTSSAKIARPTSPLHHCGFLTMDPRPPAPTMRIPMVRAASRNHRQPDFGAPARRPPTGSSPVRRYRALPTTPCALPLCMHVPPVPGTGGAEPALDPDKAILPDLVEDPLLAAKVTCSHPDPINGAWDRASRIVGNARADQPVVSLDVAHAPQVQPISGDASPTFAEGRNRPATGGGWPLGGSVPCSHTSMVIPSRSPRGQGPWPRE